MRVKVKYSRRREGFLLSGRTSWWANYLFLGDSYNIKINYNKVSYIDSIVLRSLNLRLVNHLGSNLINGNEDSFILGSRIFKPSGTLNNLRYLSLRRKGFLRTYRGLVIGNSGFNNHFYDFNLVGSYSKFYYHRYLLKRIVKRSCLKPRRRFKRRGKRKRRRPNFYKYYRRLRKKKRKSSRRRKKRKRKRRHKKFRFFFQKTNIPGYRRFRIRYRPRCYRFHHKYVHYRTNLLFRTINKVKYYIGLLYNSNFLFTPRCNYISKQFLGKSVLNYSDSNDSKFSNFFLKKKLIKNLVYSFGIRRSRRCRRRKGPLFRTWYRLYPKNVIKSFKPIGFMYSRWKRKYRVYGYSCEYQMQRYKFNRFLRKKFFFKRRNKFNFSEALPYIYKHRNIINLRKSIEIKRRFKRSHDIYKNIRYSLLDFCRDLMLTKLKCKNILSNFKILRINNFLFYKYRKLIRLNYKFYNSYNLSNSYKF